MSVSPPNANSTLNEFLKVSNRTIQRRDDWYTRFTIDGLLPPDVDSRLRSTFPNWILEHLSNDALTVNIGHDDPRLAEFLSEFPDWKNYVELLASGFFLAELLLTFRLEIRKRYPLFWRPILSNRALQPKNLYLTVQFSASKRGFRLTPHSDDTFKIISLIHYFPEFANNGESVGGTRFFTPRNPKASISDLRNNSNWSRGIRKFLPFRLAPSFEYSLARKRTSDEQIDPAQLSKFREKFDESEVLEYSANRMTGFIKNAWSIHEVDLSDFPDDELRRAIIVNVRLKQPYSVKILDEVDRFLSSVKSRIFPMGRK